mgnify:FL=1
MIAIKEFQGIKVKVYPMPFVMRAFTIGLMWRGRIYHVNPSKISNVMLGHELVHVEQWKTNKSFYIKYFLIWLRLALTFKRAYKRHPMELEATILQTSYRGWENVGKDTYKKYWKYLNITDLELSQLMYPKVDMKQFNEKQINDLFYG